MGGILFSGICNNFLLFYFDETLIQVTGLNLVDWDCREKQKQASMLPFFISLYLFGRINGRWGSTTDQDHYVQNEKQNDPLTTL